MGFLSSTALFGFPSSWGHSDLWKIHFPLSLPALVLRWALLPKTHLWLQLLMPTAPCVRDFNGTWRHFCYSRLHDTHCSSSPLSRYSSYQA